MAEMCFSAYKVRLHNAGYDQYTIDVANDWREDLVGMFSHAASKGTIKQDSAARHLIPRLVVLVPRNNRKKDELVKEFAKHYESLRYDMVIIDKIMDSGCQIVEHIAQVCESLYGQHKALANGEKWRSIMPYTPLPLHSLRVLCGLIKYSQPYHLLGYLITTIDDIENWLTSPPASFDIPTGLIDEVMLTLQEATEDKIARTSIGPDAQQMAQYREQKAQSLRLQKESEVRQQENSRLEAVRRVEAEQEQLKQKIKSLEMAAARERAQETTRKLAEAAAVAQRERSYQDQLERNTAEINRLSTDLAKLAAKQTEKRKQQDTSTPLAPIVSGQPSTSTSSSFASNQTTISSFSQPQSSLGTSFGSSTDISSYGKPGSSGPVSHRPTPKDEDVPMVDVQGVDTSHEHSTNFGRVSISDPSIRTGGQSNLFNSYISKAHPTDLLGSSDGNFKAACPAYKNGTCTLGRGCKLPHTACKFWLTGDCKYGGRCYRSHDPFFLSEAAARGQSQQSSEIDSMSIDSVPTPRDSPFSQGNPFSSHLPSTMGRAIPLNERMTKNGQPILRSGQQIQTFGSQRSDSMNSFSHPTPPNGPRDSRPIAGRITRNDQPISSHGSRSASNHGGNTPGQQAPPTGPRGINFLIKGTAKSHESSPSRGTMFGFADGDGVSGYEVPPTRSRGRGALADRITRDNQPISSQNHSTASSSDRYALGHHGGVADVIQLPRDKTASKKVACKNYLKGRCNKDDKCQYAHRPCPRFLDGTCRFGEDRCKKSHDPAFLNQGPSSDSVQQSSQSQAHPQHSLTPLIRSSHWMLPSIL
jgi:hypothetical protein